MRTRLLITMLSTGLLTTSAASAGVVTYSTSSDWTNAGSTDGTITFSSLSPGSYTSLTVSPFVFTPLVSTSLGITNSFGPGTGNFIYTLQSVRLAPTATTFGVGFNLGCYSCVAGAPSVVVKDVNNNTFTFSGMTTPGFWGFRSDLAISSITVNYSNNYVALDDISYSGTVAGGGASVPEAATIVMIGTGLALLARYRKFAVLPRPA